MAALGAAYLAGLGIGFWAGTAELEKKWRVEMAFTPHMGTSQRDDLYARWKRAVERTLNWAR